MSRRFTTSTAAASLEENAMGTTGDQSGGNNVSDDEKDYKYNRHRTGRGEWSTDIRHCDCVNPVVQCEKCFSSTLLDTVTAACTTGAAAISGVSALSATPPSPKWTLGAVFFGLMGYLTNTSSVNQQLHARARGEKLGHLKADLGHLKSDKADLKADLRHFEAKLGRLETSLEAKLGRLETSHATNLLSWRLECYLENQHLPAPPQAVPTDNNQVNNLKVKMKSEELKIAKLELKVTKQEVSIAEMERDITEQELWNARAKVPIDNNEILYLEKLKKMADLNILRCKKTVAKTEKKQLDSAMEIEPVVYPKTVAATIYETRDSMNSRLLALGIIIDDLENMIREMTQATEGQPYVLFEAA